VKARAKKPSRDRLYGLAERRAREQLEAEVIKLFDWIHDLECYGRGFSLEHDLADKPLIAALLERWSKS
jgi:hypothetical protein